MPIAPSLRKPIVLTLLGVGIGLAGCIVLGNQAEPAGAQCVVDYDECLELEVEVAICESIYDACMGGGGGGTGGSGGDEGGGGCWGEVLMCLETHDGDEDQCQALIDACQGDEVGPPPDDDDGPSCWDEVEDCYATNPDTTVCEMLAQQCLGGDDVAEDDGPEPDEGNPEDDGMQCEEILESCARDNGMGESEVPADCWMEYEACLGIMPCDAGDPGCCQQAPDGCSCEEQRDICYAQGQDSSLCEQQYAECTGMPTDDGYGDEVCSIIESHCYDYGAKGKSMFDCEQIVGECYQPGKTPCVPWLFECLNLDVDDTDGLANVDPQLALPCYEQLDQCVQEQ